MALLSIKLRDLRLERRRRAKNPWELAVNPTLARASFSSCFRAAKGRIVYHVHGRQERIRIFLLFFIFFVDEVKC